MYGCYDYHHIVILVTDNYNLADGNYVNISL